MELMNTADEYKPRTRRTLTNHCFFQSKTYFLNHWRGTVVSRIVPTVVSFVSTTKSEIVISKKKSKKQLLGVETFRETIWRSALAGAQRRCVSVVSNVMKSNVDKLSNQVQSTHTLNSKVRLHPTKARAVDRLTLHSSTTTAHYLLLPYYWRQEVQSNFQQVLNSNARW